MARPKTKFKTMKSAYVVTETSVFSKQVGQSVLLKSKEELFSWLEEVTSKPKFAHLNIVMNNVPESFEEGIELLETAMKKEG